MKIAQISKAKFNSSLLNSPKLNPHFINTCRIMILKSLDSSKTLLIIQGFTISRKVIEILLQYHKTSTDPNLDRCNRDFPNLMKLLFIIKIRLNPSKIVLKIRDNFNLKISSINNSNLFKVLDPIIINQIFFKTQDCILVKIKHYKEFMIKMRKLIRSYSECLIKIWLLEMT